MRRQQTEAYEAYSAAAWKLVDEMFAGAIDRALRDENFLGVDEAWDELPPLGTRLTDAMRKIMVIGGSRANLVAPLVYRDFFSLVALTYPRRGAEHPVAHAQRDEYQGVITNRVLLGMRALRADLGLLSKKEAAALDVKLKEWTTEEPPGPRRELVDAERHLKEWRVRDWFWADADSGYERSDYPWSMLPTNSVHMMQPLAGVLTKQVGSPWRAAVREGLTDQQRAEIYADMLSTVRHGGRGGPTLHAFPQWVTSTVPGEQIWFWPDSSLPAVMPISE